MFVAHQTRRDFSFLRAILMWGGVLALVAIIGGPCSASSSGPGSPC